METVKETPVLQDKGTRGLAKYWQGQVVKEELSDDAETEFGTRTKSWQELAGGGTSVVTTSEVRWVKGKNTGKANETTSRSQSLFNLGSMETKRRDQGYHEEGEVSTILTKPMLANKYKARKGKVTFPCYVQPKLDGIRCLADNKKAWSRGGKLLIPEVVQHILQERDDVIMDGELVLPLEPPKDRVRVEIEEGHLSYSPEEWGFQSTMKAVKKYNPELSPHLQHQVYDIILEGVPFRKRYEILKSIVETSNANLVLVQTYIVNSHAEILEWHDKFVAEGYEGSIIRSANGMYKTGGRPDDLLKHKDFVDAEFKITDVIEGQARETGCAIFCCITSEGKEFRARPKGETADRKKMFEDRESLIGKDLTVRYQNLSDEGIPRFPVGINVRDYALQG